MSGDKNGRLVRRPRVGKRVWVPPGPLRELKDLLNQVYLEAGPPTLDEINERVKADDGLAGAPGRDTIRRVLWSDASPTRLPLVTAIATVLAQQAGWDVADLVARIGRLWPQVRQFEPLGIPLDQLTDPFSLEVHRPITIDEAGGLPPLPTYVRRRLMIDSLRLLPGPPPGGPVCSAR